MAKEVKTTSDKEKNSFISNSSEFSWATEYPELQRACFFSQICRNYPPKRFGFNVIQGKLQEGPTCGLTALSMLLGNGIDVKVLLKEAKSLNLTNNGEMFSANSLLKLLQLQNLDNIEATLHEGYLDCDFIRNELVGKCTILVPYDADVNHRPSLQRGHRAHWALVVGYLVDWEDEFYLLCRHGKSKNLSAWNLSFLSESNANLNEFMQPKNHEDKEFVLPMGGIDGPDGICKKAIVVKGVEANFIQKI